MRNLTTTLLDYDLDMLNIIANRWDVDLETRDVQKAAQHLAVAMLDAEQAEHEWSRLSDTERGALQMVLGANKEHRLPSAQFSRLFGEIRQMGEGKRQREKPHLNPQGVGEVLYYRGLISTLYDQGKAGAQVFIYVPPDLAAILPVHQTGYNTDIEPEAIPLEELPPEATLAGDPPVVQKATTALVDDLTMVLTYLRIHDVQLENGYLPENIENELLLHMIGPAVYARLDLIIRLIWQLDLVRETEGYLRVNPDSRLWLEKSRTEQIEILVRTWEESQIYNEIFHLPAIQPELTGWQNDPRLLRQALQEILGVFPDGEWLLIEDMIQQIKLTDPDFQRPGGDYESWYIRDASTGDYLRGFDTWDMVEGNMLYFGLAGPMFWLGLIDLGLQDEQSPAVACRTTAFGRARIRDEAFPQRSDPEVTVQLENDLLLVPRAISRFDRFQLARFTEWVAMEDPLQYRLTADSLRLAGNQGIKLEHIQSFLQRVTGQAVPDALLKKMTGWLQSAELKATIEQVVILRLENKQQLDTLLNNPALRRYTAKRLGSNTVIVRENQAEALIEALQKEGITVEQNL